MNKSFTNGALKINAKNRMEYLGLILSYEEQGYDFVTLNEPRGLRYGMLGLAGAGEPLVWLTLAMSIHHSEELDAESPDESDGAGPVYVVEMFVSVADYYRAYYRHKNQDCGLVDLTDTLSVRPAFLCRTCHTIVRAKHDECIDLARALAQATRQCHP